MAGTETIVKIECEIDDMNPQLFGPVSDGLFTAGALDVFLTAVQMKKGRPGTLLTVLSPEAARERLTDLVFRETTTLGVRFQTMQRETLERRWESVAIAGGSVRIKVASRRGDVRRGHAGIRRLPAAGGGDGPAGQDDPGRGHAGVAEIRGCAVR